MTFSKEEIEIIESGGAAAFAWSTGTGTERFQHWVFESGTMSRKTQYPSPAHLAKWIQPRIGSLKINEGLAPNSGGNPGFWRPRILFCINLLSKAMNWNLEALMLFIVFFFLLGLPYSLAFGAHLRLNFLQFLCVNLVFFKIEGGVVGELQVYK
jgi:hypothetical protein